MARIKPVKSRVYTQGQSTETYESYTSISKFLRCPVEFCEVYFDKDREPSTLPLVFGNAMHSLVEQTLIDKQLGGQPWTPAKVRNRWEACWQNELFQTKQTPAGLKLDETSPERFFEQGLECSVIWLEKWLPKIEVRDVEVGFLVSLKDISRKIYGRLDYTEFPGVLVDLKTSGRPYRRAVEEYGLQFAFYHLGYYSLYHEWPKSAKIMRVETAGAPNIEPFDISLSKQEVQETFDSTIRPTMVKICEAWESGIFPCTCSRGHKTVNFYEAQKAFQDRKDAEAAARVEVLDPARWAKEHAEELLKAALAEGKEKREEKKIDPDEIPF